MMPSCITDAAACSAVDALKLDRIVDSCSAAAKRGRPASFCMLGEKNNLGDKGQDQHLLPCPIQFGNDGLHETNRFCNSG